MKKGFTLIELLAVIVILAIIALIATPIIIEVVEDAKESSRLSQIEFLISGGKHYCGNAMFNEEAANKIKNEENVYDEIIMSSDKPENGEMYISENCDISLKVSIGDNYYVKQYGQKVEELEKEKYDKTHIGTDLYPPSIGFNVVDNKVNSDGWANENFYVNLEIEDLQSGVKEYIWCSDVVECEPTVSSNDGNVFISTESETNYVCVIAVDNLGNQSEKECKVYKLDKTNPILGEIVFDGEIVNGYYTGEVTVSITDSTDELSGIQSSTLSPEVGAVIGDGEITYTLTAVDKAGNTNSKSVTIKKDSTAPSTPEISGGSTEYALEQTITITTVSTDETSGISHYEYYVQTSLETPSDTVTALGTTDGDTTFTTAYNGEYVFFRAVDNAGNKSGWSNGQQLYVEPFNGTFDLSSNTYNKITVTNMDFTTEEYILKYASGIQNEEYFYASGTDITSTNEFTVGSNGIYTVAALNTDQTTAITKKVYVYNFTSSSTRSRSTTVTLDEGVNIVGTAFTNTGTATATQTNTSLALTASSGSYWDYTDYYTYSCPNGGTRSGTTCTGSSYGISSTTTYTMVCVASNGGYDIGSSSCSGNCDKPCSTGYSNAGASCSTSGSMWGTCSEGDPNKTVVKSCSDTCVWNGDYAATRTYSSTTYYYRYTVGIIIE